MAGTQEAIASFIQYVLERVAWRATANNSNRTLGRQLSRQRSGLVSCNLDARIHMADCVRSF